MPHILVVEDEPDTAGDIATALRAEGHQVTHVADGAEAIALAMRQPFDAITLDRMMPGLDGVSFVRQLREQGHQAPVLMISAMGDVDDRIAGLRAGGDDYLVKPFAFSELLARVNAITRRNTPRDNAEPVRLRVADLEIDLIRRTVTRRGKSIDLQAQEFRLLEFLMRNMGRTVTRTMLLENVWDLHFDPRTNIVETHISRLRSKVDRGYEAELIHTVRGVGYSLRAD